MNSSLKKEWNNNKWLYIIFIIPFLYIAIFSYLPMGGIAIAFQKFDIFKGIFDSKFVGLDNFKRLFNDPYFGRLFRNTVLLNLYGILWGFPVPIIMAIAFNEIRNKYFKKLGQTISYMPYFISVVIVSAMLIQLLSPTSGLVNGILKKLGLESIYFLGDPKYFRTIYIASDIWQGAGYRSIMYLAAIVAIPEELSEAAVMDGANRMKRIWYIIIPGLIPTMVIMLLITLGTCLSSGQEKVLLLYNQSIYETADVFFSYVFREGIQEMNYSYSQAVALFQNVVSFILVFTANKISSKVNETSLW